LRLGLSVTRAPRPPGLRMLTSLQEMLAQPCAAMVGDDAVMQVRGGTRARLQAGSVPVLTCWSHCPASPPHKRIQRVRAFKPDAVLGIGVPSMSSDSCGCVVSHLLGGVPAVSINGHPLVDVPPSIPQVSALLSTVHTLHAA
jgi:hypothetical protein